MDVGITEISFGFFFGAAVAGSLLLWVATLAVRRMVETNKVRALLNSSFKLNNQEVNAKDFELLSTHKFRIHGDCGAELRVRVFLLHPTTGQVVVLHQMTRAAGTSDIYVSVFDSAWFRNTHLNSNTPGFQKAAANIEKRRKKQAEIDAQSIAW